IVEKGVKMYLAKVYVNFQLQLSIYLMISQTNPRLVREGEINKLRISIAPRDERGYGWDKLER
ncbi:hypothetical protein ACQUZF_09415, partial [Streptococcus pyogenes]